ncbi:signal peptidase II [Phycicoccus sp. Root101]|uniref:signal peptidase II n=1 Tax=Phycicoccus sp. Root101 TaxID=1736421 RepID=UPI000702ECD5|nr:signal peptidase II [Phycicoccus sp. Root101]KQU68979.1 hypothetical protein ASC58_10055 [Phycicoccus sp. Root101]
MAAPEVIDQSRAFRLSMWRAALLGLSVACLDLVSKAVAEQHLSAPAVLTNDDLSLGLAGGGQSVLVALMAGGIIVAGVVSWRAMAARRVPWWPVALVLGGAVGNLVDRFLRGSVRDFIPAGPLVVNIADIAVFLGLVAAAIAWQRSQPLHAPEHQHVDAQEGR